MMGLKICFYREIWIIIPKLSPLPLLIWSSASYNISQVSVTTAADTKWRQPNPYTTTNVVCGSRQQSGNSPPTHTPTIAPRSHKPRPKTMQTTSYPEPLDQFDWYFAGSIWATSLYRIGKICRVGLKSGL